MIGSRLMSVWVMLVCLLFCPLYGSAWTLSGVVSGKKTVLVLESYHKEYPWSQEYEKGLIEVLGEECVFEYFYMDTKRLPASEHQKMGDQAMDKVASMNPDLIIAGDDAVLRYTGPRLERLEIPVVYLGINGVPQNYFAQRLKNVTGVLERPLLHESVAVMKKLQPNLKRLAVLFDSDLTAKVTKEEVFGGRDHMDINGVQTDILLLDTYAAWQDFIGKSREKYDACVMGLYHTLKDKDGKNVDPEAVARWTSSASVLPVYAFWDFTVAADKAIGGLIVSGLEQGRLAGRLAKRILSGIAPTEVTPVVGDNGSLMFSAAQLKKHNLTLPADLQQAIKLVD